MQELLAINVGIGSFSQWKDEQEEQWKELLIHRRRGLQYPPLEQFWNISPPDPNDGLEVLGGGTRLLCRGGIAMTPGNSGSGKSTLSMGMAVMWSCGLKYLGIKPCGQLKSLIIEGEDDMGDLGEMKRGLKLAVGSSMDDTIMKNVKVVYLPSVCGEQFWEAADYYLKEFTPDIFWINPLLTYFADDPSDPKATIEWLARLKTLIIKYNCACVLVHHTNKPLRTVKGQSEDVDPTYAHTGTAMWSNQVRLIWYLHKTKIPGYFELVVGKRENRLGWVDEFGNDTNRKLIKRSKYPKIFWEEANPLDIVEFQEAQKSMTSKKVKSMDKILSILRTNENDAKSIYQITMESLISEKTVRENIKILEDQNVVKFVTRPNKQGKMMKCYYKTVADTPPLAKQMLSEETE